MAMTRVGAAFALEAVFADALASGGIARAPGAAAAHGEASTHLGPRC